jgi:hypothetical protein
VAMQPLVLHFCMRRVAMQPLVLHFCMRRVAMQPLVLHFCMRRGENGACDAEPVSSHSHMMISRHECVMLLLLLLLLTLDRRHWIRNYHRRQRISCGVGGALWQPHYRIECG